MKIYAEDLDTGDSILEEKDAEFLNGVYLHGDLAQLNGYDLVDINRADENPCKQDQVILVTVFLANGMEKKAWGYFWKSPSKYKFYNHIPTIAETEIQHGLICSVDDRKANEDAMKKFNERAWHI